MNDFTPPLSLQPLDNEVQRAADRRIKIATAAAVALAVLGALTILIDWAVR